MGSEEVLETMSGETFDKMPVNFYGQHDTCLSRDRIIYEKENDSEFFSEEYQTLEPRSEACHLLVDQEIISARAERHSTITSKPVLNNKSRN